MFSPNNGFTFRPISQLEKYLSLNYGRNFIKSHGKNTYDFVQMQALNRIFIECEQRMWRIAHRDLIKGTISGGTKPYDKAPVNAIYIGHLHFQALFGMAAVTG